MNESLRVLQIEDSESDAALILRQLARAGYHLDSLRVDSAEAMRAALANREWDLIISDYRMPSFQAPDALNLLHESGFDYPFIVISGTIGEETAVAMMKAGASDYMMKDNLTRLVPAVARELREAESRKARRGAELAKWESEERLKLALRASNTGVWEWDLIADKVFWSPECYGVLGVDPFGETLAEFQAIVHPDDIESLMQAARRAIADDTMLSVEFRVVTGSGDVRWIVNLGQCRYADDGTPLEMIGTVINITKRKRAEQALLESRIILQSVVDSALDGVVVIDGNARIVLWNRAAEQIFGYHLDEARGQALHLLVAPENTHQAFAQGFAAFMSTGSGPIIGRTVEMTGRRKDGSTFPIELSVAPVPRPDSLWAVGVCRDITNRKNAEIALRESEQRWQFALEGAGDGVWDWRNDPPRVYYSRQWRAMLGFGEVEGPEDPEGFIILLHPDDRQRVQSDMDRHIAGDVPSYSSEYRLQCKDGTYKWIHGRGKVIERDASGRPSRIIGTQTDITLRKTAEDARDRLQAQFLQAQKMESIGRLAGGIAHDFNNLLTVINGWSALLLRGLPKGDPSREAVEEIHDSGERAAALVKQLLAFSRKDVFHLEVVDVNAVISSLRKTILGLVGADIQIRTHFDSPTLNVQSDRSQLEQVLVNLVVNAHDAMPKGGTLTITTSRVWLEGRCDLCQADITPGTYVRITVRDTGAGMDEHTRQHLFEPFFTTKETGKGTGLGLAVVHGIVTSSGGHLSFDSAPGHGTEFRIHLPPVDGLMKSGPEEHSGQLRGTEKVLLVEDQVEVRKFTRLVLTGYGYAVKEVASAEDALTELQNGPVDLLLTDVTMPAMNGLDLAQRACLLQPSLKVLLMSGHSEAILEQRHAGSTSFIAKPFSPTALAAKMREVLDRSDTIATRRILVVDDEHSIRRFVRSVLEEAGYDVVEAANGKDALTMVGLSVPDLVITDLVMPDQEGLETIRKLHAEHPHLKIIAMSGAAGGRYLQMAQPLGASLTLTKPITPQDLINSVTTVLNGKGPPSSPGA